MGGHDHVDPYIGFDSLDLSDNSHNAGWRFRRLLGRTVLSATRRISVVIDLENFPVVGPYSNRIPRIAPPQRLRIKPLDGRSAEQIGDMMVGGVLIDLLGRVDLLDGAL